MGEKILVQNRRTSYLMMHIVERMDTNYF